jgi:flagellar motor switch protein FliN/FliY
MADPSPTPPNPSGDKPSKSAKKPEAQPGAASMAEQALKAAEQAVSSLQQNAAPSAAPATPTKFDPQAFDKTAKEEPPRGIDLLSDVNLNVKIELGRTRMLVEDVLKLGEGAVVELDKLAGDPVDVYVNERHIARGEVLVLNDNFCVRINEIVQDGGEMEPVKKK